MYSSPITHARNLTCTCNHLYTCTLAIAVRVAARVEEIVKFRHVVGSDWLEYVYNVEYN